MIEISLVQFPHKVAPSVEDGYMLQYDQCIFLHTEHIKHVFYRCFNSLQHIDYAKPN